MSAVNLTVRFVCELALIAAVVWWGWPILGIVLGMAVIAVWALWIAPKSGRRLRDPLRLALELVLFACGTAAFWAAGGAGIAIGFLIVSVTTAVLVRRWPEPVH
jgi:hypothetical protein